MQTDAEIRQHGMDALIQALGLVEAERFFVLMQREHFDYTAWRKNLWQGLSVTELSRQAMASRRQETDPSQDS
jgi:hypothetical protein